MNGWLVAIPIIIAMVAFPVFTAGIIIAEAQKAKEVTIARETPTWKSKVLDNGATEIVFYPTKINDKGTLRDFIFTETFNSIIFETAFGGFGFDKTSCEFKMYEGGVIGTKQAIIDNIQYALKENNISVPLVGCLVSPVEPLPNGISFTTQQTAGLTTFITKYDLDYGIGLEVTFEVINNDPINTIGYTITETIPNFTNTDERIVFDSKNDVHGTVTREAIDKGNYVVDYSATLAPREKIIIDPSYGWTSGQGHRYLTTATSGVACSTTLLSNTTVNPQMRLRPSAISDSCRFTAFVWDDVGVPFTDAVTIINATVEVTTVATVSSARNCELRAMSNQPGIDAAQDILDDIKDGAILASGISGCTGISTFNVTLNSGGLTNLGDSLNAGTDWWAVGIPYEDLTRDASDRSTTFSTPRLFFTFTNGTAAPDAVTDLEANNVTETSVLLNWSQPAMPAGQVFDHYVINFTTPWGSPQTQLGGERTTENASITGLADNTRYSFRVGTFSNVTGNGSGNIVNITTINDFASVNFTIGFFELNASNVDSRTIKYERIDLNNTALRLNVTYPNTFNGLSCDFGFKFANTNQTFQDVSSSAIGGGENESSFLFNGTNNEVIDVLCWNFGDTTTNASYILTQSNFLLLQQIRDFRLGEFGTSGDFGVIDLVTLVSVIAIMVGFNRSNESVGAIFAVALLGGLVFFDIVEWYTFMFGSFAVIIMLVVASTRKV